MPIASRKPVEVPPSRMAAIATLPLMLDLSDKRVVVAGGTAACAIKAELLAAAGAQVEVYAAVLSDEMAALIERGAGHGQIRRQPRDWSPEVLDGAVIAAAEFDDAADAALFAERARAAGALAHVIGNPTLSQFAFGTGNGSRSLVERPSAGRVTLVGAGPGDAELLTLKAVRILQSADVILYDDLVSDDVLALARREAKRMMVGKRGKRESCSQADINDLMVKLARQGKHVVRLKSGDPMIFGRAGEEIARLESEGIAVDIVPGVTSASAMAASLGVSLTHRDHAQSVRFVTGHARSGELPDDMDWRGLADLTTSLVVYMGGRTASAFARRLMAEGMAASTPLVAVAAVTRQNERKWVGTLGEVADAGLPAEVATPVLIGIGQAFENARMLQTRPDQAAAETAANCARSRAAI